MVQRNVPVEGSVVGPIRLEIDRLLQIEADAKNKRERLQAALEAYGNAPEVEEPPVVKRREPRMGKRVVPTRAGQPVRWSILKDACDKMPGRDIRLKDLAEVLREHYPDHPIPSRALTRDLGRKTDLWQHGEAHGVYVCLWKPEEGAAEHPKEGVGS